MKGLNKAFIKAIGFSLLGFIAVIIAGSLELTGKPLAFVAAFALTIWIYAVYIVIVALFSKGGSSCD